MTLDRPWLDWVERDFWGDDDTDPGEECEEDEDETVRYLAWAGIIHPMPNKERLLITLAALTGHR